MEKMDKGYELHLVGHADLKILQKIQKITEDSSSIKFSGYLSNRKLLKMYKAADIVITLSKSEGFGLPIYEGLRLGKPFIATKGIASDVIKQFGLEIELERDVYENISIIDEFVLNLPNVRRDLNKNIGVVESTFSWERMFMDIAGRSKIDVLYVFVDHTLNVNQNSGIQTTVRQICKSLQKMGVSIRPIGLNENQEIIVPNFSQLKNLEDFSGPNANDFDLDFTIEKDSLMNKTIFIPELLLYLETSSINKFFETISNLKMKSIFILYDLLPISRSFDYSEEITLRFNFLILKMISNASYVFCISKYVENEFKSVYADNLNSSKIRIKTLTLGTMESQYGKSQDFSEGGNKTLLDFLDNSDLILFYPATYEPRKNHLSLVNVINRLNFENGSKIRLICVGWEAYPEIYADLSSVKNENLMFLKSVENEIMEFLYSRADYTIYPSLSEGYGLPIVESLKFGTRVICSDSSSMIEISKQFEPYVKRINTGEEGVFKESLEAILFVSSKCVKPNKIKSQLNLPTWDSTASEIISGANL